jgi:UDP-N-acetylglucosamine 2-epimerase
MKVLTVVGARLQFIKSAPVSKALLRSGHHEILVHTGQHRDRLMSEIFFVELTDGPAPINLNIGSGSHDAQTGRMLIELEKVLVAHRLERVLVIGDTNSNPGVALAACKLGLTLAHVEAGLLSLNRIVPEEHNRVLTDQCGASFFIPLPRR